MKYISLFKQSLNYFFKAQIKMNQREITIIDECKKFVAESLKDAEKGHGYDHI